MIRYIGVILIVGGTSYIGYSYYNRQLSRERIIAGFIAALEIIESEIMFKLSPVTDAVLAAGKVSGETSIFFKNLYKSLDEYKIPFCDAWTDGLKHIDMDMEAKEILSGLSSVIGQYDAEGQRSALAYTGARLKRRYEQLSEKRKSVGKLYITTGFGFGLILAIVLI